MKTLLEHPLYLEDLQAIGVAGAIPWEDLQGASLLLSGATGMIGSCLVDAVMYKNREEGLGCTVHALGRSRAKAQKRFGTWWDMPQFHFLEADVNEGTGLGVQADYVLHLASNTHPVAYATDPIGTITTNIIGTRNMLELAHRCGARRFVFASSNEIYGENRGDQELFDESYCGYIDCNTLRAGYPESKRCGEALCQAYAKQKGLDVVIARLTRSFGPTLQLSDTKALTQFIKNGLNHEEIILKSAGNQYYSYTYSADAVAGLMTVMLKGASGEAYNVADRSGDIRLKDLAARIAALSGTRVVFDLPSETEALGFSKATKARLDGSKLHALGWSARCSIDEGLRRTMEVLGQ